MATNDKIKSLKMAIAYLDEITNELPPAFPASTEVKGSVEKLKGARLELFKLLNFITTH